jgi:hypothetical protein
MDSEINFKKNLFKFNKDDEEEEETKKKDIVENLDLNDDTYKPKYRKRRFNEIFIEEKKKKN